MSRKKKGNSELAIGNYVVAFVDLLGQQEYLRSLTTLPDKQDTEQMNEFRMKLKQTYGAVTGMRQSFQSYFNSFLQHHISRSDLNSLPLGKKKQYGELRSEPVQFQRFSDSMVFFLSLRTNRFKLPTGGIFGILGAAASSFLIGLAAGHPIRGGIELGVAMEMTKGEIYGGALASAYALESKVACYPRIVVGEELIRYLQFTVLQEPNDVYTATGKQIAQYCLDLISVDDDGHPFLDYLGEGFKRHIAAELDLEVIHKAYQYVIDCSKKFQRERNTTLAFRYTLLRNYFEARLPLWISEI